MSGHISTVAVGAGAVLTNQTNINKNLPFFLELGGGGVEVAGENLLVSSITFNPSGTITTPDTFGIVYSSTLSVVGGQSTLNFQEPNGDGFAVSMSSLFLRDGAAQGAFVSLASAGNIKFDAPNVYVDAIYASTVNVGVINGQVVGTHPRMTVYTTGRGQLPANGQSTLNLPPNLFQQQVYMQVCAAGPTNPTNQVICQYAPVQPGQDLFKQTSFNISGDPNSYFQYIATGP